MYGHIPDSNKNEFNIELINLNFDRSRKLNLILLIISLILLLIDFLNKQKGLWLSGSKYLSYTHLLLLIVMLTLLVFFRVYRGLEPEQMRRRQY